MEEKVIFIDAEKPGKKNLKLLNQYRVECETNVRALLAAELHYKTIQRRMGLIGAVLGGFDGRRGMVYHLAISRDYRRHGIGQRLMKELELRLRTKGCLKYYLLVTKANEEALDFYESIGCEAMNLHLLGKSLS